MANHPNMIIPQYSNRAIYKITELPKYGDLFIDGKKAAVGMMFTQQDVMGNRIKYTNTSTPTVTVNGEDAFKFVVPIGESSVIQPGIEYSACIDHSYTGDAAGVFTYKIIIEVIPVPMMLNNNEKLEMFEEETYCLSPVDLRYSSDYLLPEPDYTKETFPLTYTVMQDPNADPERSASFQKNGVDLKSGDTFTTKDIEDGKICVKGLLKGAGTVNLAFNVCNEVDRCLKGKLKVKVKVRPGVIIDVSTITIDECSPSNLILSKHLRAHTSGAEDYEKIKYTIDWASTTKEEDKVTDIKIGDSSSATEFTGKNIEAPDGDYLSVEHLCRKDISFQGTQRIRMTACNEWGKCRDFTFRVVINQIKTPVVPKPAEQATTPGGCTYRMNFNGEWEPIGPCGLFIELRAREVPDYVVTAPMGQIIRIVDEAEGPKSVVKTPEGLVEVDMPTPPTSDPVNTELPAPNGRAKPGDVYTPGDGTKFIAGDDGQWFPVKGPKKPNLDPIITTGPYLPEVATLGNLPPTIKKVLHNGNVIEKDANDVWKPPNMGDITMTYNMPFFGWIGPNEFWVKSGQRINILMWSMRRRVRFDLAAARLDGIGGEFLYNNYHRNRTYKAAEGSITAGPGPIKPMDTAQIFYGRYIFEYNNPTNPIRHSQFEYTGWERFTTYGTVYAKMPDSRLVSFGATELPVNVPIYQKLVNSDAINEPKQIAEEAPYVRAFSNNDYTVRYTRSIAPLMANAAGGAAYGQIDVQEHFEGWKTMKYTSTTSVYDPVTKKYVQKQLSPEGFCLGEIQILSADNFKRAADFVTQNKGEFQPNLPKSGTYEFDVRGTDRLTGEQVFRTFKVHYGGTGLSPAGNKSETTDKLMSTLPPSMSPPVPRTAVCKFVNGVASGCYFSAKL